MITELNISSQLQILLLSMVPGIPMVLAFGMFHKRVRRLCLMIAPWTPTPALSAALLIHPVINLEVPWFFMGGRLGLDLLGQRFLMVTALLWLSSGCFASSYLKNDTRRHHFFFFYLLSMSGNFGLILAQDMLGFYLFFGLMSFAAYGLVVHNQTREAIKAGRIYIIMVMIGEVLLFSSMLLLATSSISQQLSDIACCKPDNLTFILLFLGFAIKAGALPLHFWLPLAHPAAPVPASAVLSGAMIKAGLLGWLRFFPTQSNIILPHWWGELFLLLGILAAFYGVIIGVSQKNPKTVLAYSSISQMGLMTIMVGCGLIFPNQWPIVVTVITFYVIHHGLGKAALFLGVGVVNRASNQRGVPIWMMAGLLLPILSLASMPLTSGAIAKFGLKQIIDPLPSPWVQNLSWLLPITSVGTTFLLCHFLLLIRKTTPDKQAGDIPVGIWSSWAVLLASVAGLPWVWQDGLVGIAYFVSPSAFWHGSWPVGLGLLLALSFWKWREKISFHIPEGDILELFSWIGKALRIWRPAFLFSKPDRLFYWVPDSQQWSDTIQTSINAERKFENIMKRWAVVGLCFLSLWLTLFFMLAAN